MGKLKLKRLRSCQICSSPVRGEIEKMIDSDIPHRKIAVSFKSHFPCGLVTLRGKISRHKNKHMRQQIRLSDSSLEALAECLLKIGIEKARLYPEQIKMRDVIASQKLLVDRSKLKANEGSLISAMTRLFSGFEPDESKTIKSGVIPGLVRGSDPH